MALAKKRSSRGEDKNVKLIKICFLLAPSLIHFALEWSVENNLIFPTTSGRCFEGKDFIDFPSNYFIRLSILYKTLKLYLTNFNVVLAIDKNVIILVYLQIE